MYYPTTFLTLWLGIAIAFEYGITNAFLPWMLIGNFSLHCACSMINEYRDFMTGADLVEYPQLGWKATGGSRVLVNELLNPRHVLFVSLFLFLISGGIWGFLGVITDPKLGLILTFSLGITFLYSAAFSGGGFSYTREVLLTLGAVPLFVLSVVKLLSGEYSSAAVCGGLVVGMQMLHYLLYHGVVDLEADTRSGKVRLTRMLGLRRTLIVLEILTVGTFVALAGFIYVGLLPVGCILCFGLLPLALKILHAEMKAAIHETYTLAVFLFVSSGFILSLGFLLS